MGVVWKVTPARQALFLSALIRCGSVTQAARETGVDRSYLYRRRRRDPAFARLWDQAVQRLRQAVDSRAASRIPARDPSQPSDRIVALLLSHHRPDKFDRRAAAARRRLHHRGAPS